MSKWIKINRWHSKDDGSRLPQSSVLYVREEQVALFRETRGYIYAHFKQETMVPIDIGNGNHKIPCMGIVDDSCAEYVRSIHEQEQQEANRLVTSIDALTQELQFNPFIGRIMAEGKKRFIMYQEEEERGGEKRQKMI